MENDSRLRVFFDAFLDVPIARRQIRGPPLEQYAVGFFFPDKISRFFPRQGIGSVQQGDCFEVRVFLGVFFMDVLEQESGIDFRERYCGHVMFFGEILAELCPRVGNTPLERSDGTDDEDFHVKDCGVKEFKRRRAEPTIVGQWLVFSRLWFSYWIIIDGGVVEQKFVFIGVTGQTIVSHSKSGTLNPKPFIHALFHP